MSPPTKTQLQAHHVHVAPSLQLCTSGGVHAATVPAALQVKGQVAPSNHLAPNHIYIVCIFIPLAGAD